jgi:hypothetical protein
MDTVRPVPYPYRNDRNLKLQDQKEDGVSRESKKEYCAA